MKLTVLFFLLGFLHVAAKGSSQTITLNEQHLSIEKLFAAIEEQTGYVVFYNKGVVAQEQRFTVNVKKQPLEAFLVTVFQGQPYSFIIKNKSILVTEKQSNAADYEQLLPEQLLRTITGKVLDEKGQALEGATVQVKGNSRVTKTDAHGAFSIESVIGDKIEISYVGYQAVVVTVAEKTHYVITMEVALTEFEAVEVVTDGYTRLSKERATGSFTNVISKELDKQIGALSITEKLQAFLPGILVTNDNGLTVRGKSSLKVNNGPLVVLDGFPTELSLSAINPNDVASITLLRDAAAASIWGARASNGVIVITTKSGNKNLPVQVDFATNFRIENKPDLTSLKLVNTEEYIDAELEALSKGWYNLTNPEFNMGYSRVYEIFALEKAGTIGASEAESRYHALRKNNTFDQADLFFRNARFQQYNVTLGGASGLNQYYMSVNYQNNAFTSKQGNDQRLKFLLKNTFKFTPKLLFDVAVGVESAKGRNNGIGHGEVIQQRPYELFVDENGNYIPVYDNQRSMAKNEALQAQGYYDWNKNLKQDFDNKDNAYNALNPRINLGLQYKLPAGFSFESKFLHELSHYRNDDYKNVKMYDTRNLLNTYTIINAGAAVYQIPRGTIYNANIQRMSNTTFRNQFNFATEEGGKHIVHALAGAEINKRIGYSRSERYHNYSKTLLTHSIIDELKLAGGVKNWRNNNMSYTPLRNPISETENRFISFYFNGAYSYDRRFTFSVSGRIDQTDLFGASVRDRITPLYSFGLAYNLSNEAWFDFAAIDKLTFRISQGVNGNIDKNTSKVLVATPDKNVYLTTDDFLKVNTPENKNLKWESTSITNFGVDVSFFNRIQLTLDLYNRNSFDLLGNVESDPTAGFENVYKNTAKLNNRGFDLQLSTNLLPHAFSWNMNWNFSFSKNKVVEVYNPNPTVANYILGGPGKEIAGMPIDYLYSYKTAGLSNDGEPRVYDDKGAIVSWMDNIAPETEWLVYNGTTMPRYYGSFVNTFSFKGVSITPIVVYQLGHVMRLPSPYIRAESYLQADIAKRWRKPGDEQFTYVPKFPDNPNMSNFKRTDYYKSTDLRTASASFVRLERVALSYDVPPVVLNKLFAGIQIQAQVTNAFLWKKNKEGIDPESNSLRFGDLGLSKPASYTFGLNINLK